IYEPRECDQICNYYAAFTPEQRVFDRKRAGLTNGELQKWHNHAAIYSNAVNSGFQLAKAGPHIAYGEHMALLGDWDNIE
ncbi:tRNA (cytosine(32)/uridine(32)-2'-O)-methyltransferase TrmJ, partial [Escherichia coli]|nr:tRNA (cytosine(32)/uridine(32)-2'-O)-methyltransferase TrmJ [Escherichia coli]